MAVQPGMIAARPAKKVARDRVKSMLVTNMFLSWICEL